KINPKPRIERLSECGLESVQEGHCVRDAIKGQRAGIKVQIHSYSGGAGGSYCSFIVIVPGRVTGIRAVQTPGPVTESKEKGKILSFPADSFICDSYRSPSPTALNLPVTASPRQTLSAKHLIPVVKSLWVIGISLVLSPLCHFSVPFRQTEVSMHCVGVQCELTGI
ncbi:hypothetical protein EOD39_19911, partial [Acipenser ruthenus]